MSKDLNFLTGFASKWQNGYICILTFICMAHNDFKRFIWLIALLYNTGGATFAEIDMDWQDQEDLNPDGKSLPKRTFNNYREYIKELFGLSIDYSTGDKKYHISDTLYSGRMQQALLLLSSISLWNRKDSYKKMAGRILYEEEPFVYPKFMRRILSAMDSDNMITLDYKKYGDRAISHRKLAPYCLKMFKRRWYLTAKEGNAIKTFCLDSRTCDIRINDVKFRYPEDFNPEEYFKDVFGIRKAPAKDVVLKAYGQEADYLRSAPIHPSQKETEKGTDYAIFSLHIGTNAWEFYQEILSRGNRIEVLEPQSLREDIARKIDDMRERYASSWQRQAESLRNNADISGPKKP